MQLHVNNDIIAHLLWNQVLGHPSKNKTWVKVDGLNRKMGEHTREACYCSVVPQAKSRAAEEQAADRPEQTLIWD